MSASLLIALWEVSSCAEMGGQSDGSLISSPISPLPPKWKGDRMPSGDERRRGEVVQSGRGCNHVGGGRIRGEMWKEEREGE